MKAKKIDLKQLEEIFEHKQTALFCMTWFENGLNATKAYMKLHPNVDYNSARVLGSRQLTKVNIPAILNAGNLGIETYLQKLKEGLNAMIRIDRSTKAVPDHKTRRLYHKILGELLGIEGKETKINSSL